MRARSHSGFTLIELSIVLVIIGLLVGGVMVGRDLIRQATLRGVIAEYEQYIAAVNTFKLKFNTIPGDMPNATSFWGIHVAGVNCQLTPSAGTATCDGDGDGILEQFPSYSTARANEFFRFWHHLYNAGLIGFLTYGTGGDGTANNNSAHVCIGRNVPKSKLDPAGWHAWYSDGTTFTPIAGNVFILGAKLDCATSSMTNTRAALSALDARTIDSKIDNSTPADGKVIAYEASAGCTTGNAYDNGNTIACVLFFTGNF
jgi:prepilin-type N-terminal cleavage/methylation domain-containing protein